MPIKQNIVRGWVTTIIGTGTMLISLMLVWQKVFDFVWEGIGGITIGAVLVMAPQTIEKAISQVIRAWGGKARITDKTNEDI